VIKPETARAVRRMLELAAQPGGTAPKAQVGGYRVAGKTGTAHKLEGRNYANKYVAAFVGFAPVSNPRLIVAVMIGRAVGRPVLRRRRRRAGVLERHRRRAAPARRALRRAVEQRDPARRRRGDRGGDMSAAAAGKSRRGRRRASVLRRRATLAVKSGARRRA